MKRLMITASAALCAAVGFCVESSNIVGYQTKGFDYQAYWQRSACFNDIGDFDGYSIQQLVPKSNANAVDPMADGEAQIQTLNDGGATDQTYFYLIGGAESAMPNAGWYTLSGGIYTLATKTFVRGEGFIYMSPYAEDDEGDELETTLQSAGQVNTAAKTITHDYQAYYQRANYRPVEMSIQKLVPASNPNAVDPMADGEAQIQTLNDGGATDQTYFYLIGGAESAMPNAGWYTLSGGVYTLATKTFGPGEGFIFMSPYAEDDEGDELPTTLTFNE